MPKAAELSGQRFGRLIAIKRVGSDFKGNALFECMCDCGKIKIFYAQNLKTGHSKSCGCFKIERAPIDATKHNGIHTLAYSSWLSMRQRCLNKDHPRYSDWGGRDISICDRWLNSNGFANFFEDMGERPKGKTLDRYPNNDGNYEPSNCRWATPKEQANNRRRKSVSSS